MYPVSQQINQEAMQPYPDANINTSPMPMAKGDHVGRDYTFAHFNKNELPMLDDWQGGARFVKGTKIRNLAGIEKRFKGDDLFKGVLDRHLSNHLKNGKIEEFKMMAAEAKPRGRFGDTEVALIGPGLRKYLDHYSGGHINPHTGFPEYWSLSGMLGSLGSGLKSAAGTVGQGMNTVGQYAMPFLKPLANEIGQRYGVEGAGDIGENLWNTASKGLRDIGGVESEQQQLPSSVQQAQDFMKSPLASNLGKAVGAGYDAYKGGADAGGAAYAGAQNLAGRYSPALAKSMGNYQKINQRDPNASFSQRVARTAAANMGNMQGSPIGRGMQRGMAEYGRSGIPMNAIKRGFGAPGSQQRPQNNMFNQSYNDNYQGSQDPSMIGQYQ